MSKSRKGSGRGQDWNPSHRTRFTSENQPARRRGPAKIKIDRNILRMMADCLNEAVNVTNQVGQRLDMTQAHYLVRAMINKAAKGGFDDHVKLFDRFSKWGLLGQLEVEEGLLDELKDMLEAERKRNEDLQAEHEVDKIQFELWSDRASALLRAVDELLARESEEPSADITALRREILRLQLEMEGEQRREARSNSRNWTSGRTDNEWLEEFNREFDEENRLIEDRLAEFDRQNPPSNDDPEDNPDPHPTGDD